jgi:hypothetical protein
MNNRNDNAKEDHIPGINPEHISEIVYRKWKHEGKDLRQIAREIKRPIGEVQRILSQKQKLLIRKGSIKR